jgi:tRNA-specific 2-thiouridylase
MKIKKKIVVAMSGGVDSSVAASLFREEGHDVRGLSLRAFDPGRCQEGEEKTCCSARDIRDARRVAARLEIPFTSWDIRPQFEEEVVRPFIREYCAGRTPNPCVLCNSRIKFRLLLEKVAEMGADFLATGHYARIGREGGSCVLRKGVDNKKDQSYFLFEIGARVLPRILFPLGEMTKEEVRRRARALGVEVAEKRESQEICFIPGNDYAAFLRGRLAGEGVGPGPIMTPEGTRLGTHRGLIHYTVGQRRGLGVATGQPLYVVRLDRENNALVVGGNADLERGVFDVGKVTWPGKKRGEAFRAAVKIRYRHREAPATVTPLGPSSCRVEFDRPQRAVTPGQAAVFYDGDRLLGGGWIEDIGAN